MISENIQLLPDSGGESARITITSDHTIINGNHIRISNGYMHNTNGSASIATKDILSIEKQTLRKKRLLVVGLSLFGIMILLNGVFGQIGRYFTFQAAADGDPMAQLRVLIDIYGGPLGREILHDEFAEMLQGDFLDWDDWLYIMDIVDMQLDAHDAYEKFMSYQAAMAGDFSRFSLFEIIRYGALAALFIPSVFCVGIYTLKPVRVLRIKALGADLAVEVKYYKDEDINAFVKMYYNPVARTSNSNKAKNASFCRSCGKQLESDEAFCAQCGSPTNA